MEITLTEEMLDRAIHEVDHEGKCITTHCLLSQSPLVSSVGSSGLVLAGIGRIKMPEDARRIATRFTYGE